MTTQQLHHINYLVKDLAISISYFEKIFQQKPVMDAIEKRGVLTASFNLGGVLFILVQPTSEEGEVAETLASNGEGVFLISFSVDDLSQAIARLEAEQICVNHASKREGLNGWQVCDLEPVSPGRTIVQLCQE